MDEQDRTTCARALRALEAHGVVETSDAAWLSRALDGACGGAAGGVAIPWASWGIRIAERARLDEVAGGIGVAVAAVAADLGVEQGEGAERVERSAPDAVLRFCVAGQVFEQLSGPARALVWLLSASHHPAAALPENPSVDGRAPAAAAAPRSGARELVALWAAAALITGEEVTPWGRFGERIAEPVGVLHGLARLWLAAIEPDLERAALTPLLALWLCDTALAPPLLRAFAGERRSPVRRFEILSLAASRPYRAALADRMGQALSAAREALPAASRLSAAGSEFLDVLAERLRFFDSVMAARDVFNVGSALERAPGSAGICRVDEPRRAPATPRDRAQVDRGFGQVDRGFGGAARLGRAKLPSGDLDAALVFLADTAPWPGSWEVQRFGVLGSAEQPVSQWFARGTILRALFEVGRDVRAGMAALLDEIPPGELRYYGAWPGIPPDADDLGLMLELAAATGWGSGRRAPRLSRPGAPISDAPRDPRTRRTDPYRQARVETWIEVMLANVRPDGVVPTWFYRSPDGTEHAGTLWAGDDCTAVRLNLLIGLLSFDPARFDALIQQNARRVLAVIGPARIDGLCFYDASYAGLAFLRFARLYQACAASRPLAAAIAEVQAALLEQAAASQRLDGGWGSPQRTAACLEGAAISAAPDRLLLERGVRYLGEHQLADGSWPAEPLYLLPLKGGREGRHEGRELTTALCARALGAAIAALVASDDDASGGDSTEGDSMGQGEPLS